MSSPNHERPVRFSLRSLLATVGFVAFFLALVLRNYAAFRDAMAKPDATANRAFTVPELSREYSVVWFSVVVVTAIMLPPLIKLKLRTPALVFMCASACAMVVNYMLPVGMM